MAKKQKELTTEDKWRALSLDLDTVRTPEGFRDFLSYYRELTNSRVIDAMYPSVQSKVCEQILKSFCKTRAGKKALKKQLKEYKKVNKLYDCPKYEYAHDLYSLTFYTIALNHANFDMNATGDIINRMRKNGCLNLGNSSFRNGEFEKEAALIAEADGATLVNRSKDMPAKKESKYAKELVSVENELNSLNKKTKTKTKEKELGL